MHDYPTVEAIFWILFPFSVEHFLMPFGPGIQKNLGTYCRLLHIQMAVHT